MFTSVSASHLSSYTRQMAAALDDKLFFTPHINADVYVDFGCADGTLLEALAPTGAHLVGFDLCPNALKTAKTRVDGAFFSDWDSLLFHLEPYQERTIALIASSVIHEVYAYGGAPAGETFWNRVNTGPWKTVAIRDMALRAHQAQTQNHLLAQRVRNVAPEWQVASFENQWGSLDNQHTLTHFLLTYRYTQNWDRELNENYLPLSSEDIDAKMKGWKTQLTSHEVIPFLDDTLNHDFGVRFPTPTHIKRIFRR